MEKSSRALGVRRRRARKRDCYPCVRLLVLAIFGSLKLLAQFSPGALSNAHHQLDGPTHCTSCHAPRGGVTKFRCSGCHAEIANHLNQKRGWHPALMAGKHGDDACIKCHSEHNGRDFVPVLWEVSREEFDHRKAGYALVGGHAGLECKKCHSPQHIAPQERKLIRIRDLTRTYFGLDTQCLTCHQDEHRGQVGVDCEHCHVFTKWKDVTHFDHAKAKFVLTGAHNSTKCEKCHKEEPADDRTRPRIRYTGIPFARCQDCHQDPHKGTLSATCGSCHNDITWKALRNVDLAFDHSKTKYPLLGKHQSVSCGKCHHGADFKTPVAHELCINCHKDSHQGQFLARSDKGECAACHTVDGWKPSSFTVVAHAKSAYPLLGRHAALACAKCHTPAGQATLYRVKFQNCLDCHTDSHKGQFAAAPHQNRCEDCHSVDRFTPANFTLARHRETRFPLEGGHTAVSCADCHKVVPDGRNVAAFHFADVSCPVCHVDPHLGQFDARMRKVSSGTGKSGCESCHSVKAWSDLPGFDHSATRFVLTGSHVGVSCEQCHRASPVSTGLKSVIYRDTTLRCTGCHEDVHLGQFRTLSNEFRDCAACHGTGLWHQAHFNHDKASFRLTGAHEKVPCSGCHKHRREVAGRLVLFYAPTPKECAACHGKNVTS